MKEELKRSISDEVETLKTSLTTNLKGEFTKLRSDTLSDITEIKHSQVQIKEDVATNKKDIKVCKDQMSNMEKVLIRQEQMLEECKSQIEDLKETSTSNIIRIRGILEHKNEKCASIVSDFFKTKLRINGNIPIVDAFRIGEGKDRVIKVILRYARDKWKVFGHTKNLKDVLNENNKPFQINAQLPARKFEMRRRQRHIAATNKKKSVAQKLRISFEKSNMLINGEPYVKAVKNPTRARLATLTSQDVSLMEKMDVAREAKSPLTIRSL